MFKAYQHVERFGTDEVEGIDTGVCFIFSKIDGTNASVWSDEVSMHPGQLAAGSRNRQLTLESDNFDFLSYVLQPENTQRFIPLFCAHPTWRLYGEYLVPHTLRTYRQDAWRKFYIFDVYDDELKEYLPYEIYQPKLELFSLEYIPPLCKINNPTIDQLNAELEKNTYLIVDGAGAGEGIVIKNYDGYRNKYGRQTWAKIVRNEFKERNAQEFGVRVAGEKRQIEVEVAQTYVTAAFVEKTRAKIENEGVKDRKSLIPRLLQTCYHDLVCEEIWNIMKRYKNPEINFKKLQAQVIYWVKQYSRDLF